MHKSILRPIKILQIRFYYHHPNPEHMKFNQLEIIEPILRALKAEGYTQPTPIQEKSIPVLLKGKDLLGCAQTGTGKTAAFTIPILQHLYQHRQKKAKSTKPRALVVTPTRELAIQIGDSFAAYGKFTGIRNTVIFGGVKQTAQVNALRTGVNVLVATPGRLLDLMGQGFISLQDIQFFVLDEADRMLDMGFIHDIRKIIEKLPAKRQSLFFSATMPPDIMALSRKILGNPEKVIVESKKSTAEKVEQALYFVNKKVKPKLLVYVLKKESVSSALVFSRTKHGANKIVGILRKADIAADAIHGNKTQASRQRALKDFKDGRIHILVATDIAARGIDVDNISHVINYDLPDIPETYVHRIGRTGRAGASGIALSFCDAEGRAYLNDIQKLIVQDIAVIDEHPFHDESVRMMSSKDALQNKPKQGGGQQRRKPKPANANRNTSTRNSDTVHSKRHRFFSKKKRSGRRKPTV